MNDLISRADAIELVSDMLEWEHYDKPTVNEAIAIIRDVAAVQSYPHWIPAIVTPDSDRRVLCLTKTKKGVLNYVLGYYAHDRKYWVCGMNSNVIAWMDLPEPPEEEQT